MKAVIHIGTYKTGTSSIQFFLSRNRESLNKQRIFVPFGFPRTAAHHKLGIATYLPKAWESWPMFSFLGHCFYSSLAKKFYADDITLSKKGITPKDQNKLWETYRHEIETNCHKDDLVIFSTEMLTYFLENEVARVKELMDSLFDDVTIVVYLRRQPEYLVSLYGNYVMGGSPWGIFDYLNMPDDRSVLAYHQIVKRWSLFGKDKIKICLFDKKAFHENDLLSDFAHTVGFDPTGLERVENINETFLDSAGMEFLRLFNSHVPMLLDPWTLNFDRYPLPESIISNSLNDGKKNKKAWHLNREEAQRILEQCREGNDWIAREYLGREKLFDEDVSMYPETVASPHGLTPERCVEITARLCKELHAGKHAFGLKREAVSQPAKVVIQELPVASKMPLIPHYKVTRFLYNRYRLLSNVTFGKLRAKYNEKRKAVKKLLNENRNGTTK